MGVFQQPDRSLMVVLLRILRTTHCLEKKPFRFGTPKPTKIGTMKKMTATIPTILD